MRIEDRGLRIGDEEEEEDDEEEERGVMVGGRALMTLILSQQEPLMKILPKSFIVSPTRLLSLKASSSKNFTAYF